MKVLIVDKNEPGCSSQLCNIVRTHDDALRALVYEEYDVISIAQLFTDTNSDGQTLTGDNILSWLSDRKFKYMLHTPTSILRHTEYDVWEVFLKPNPET